VTWRSVRFSLRTGGTFETAWHFLNINCITLHRTPRINFVVPHLATVPRQSVLPIFPWLDAPCLSKYETGSTSVATELDPIRPRTFPNLSLFQGRDETGNDSSFIRWTRHTKSPIAVEQRTAIECQMSGPGGQKMPLQPVHLLADAITQCYIYLY
jgi:hypothetical protein